MARPATGQVVVRKRNGGKTFGLRFRAYGKRRYMSLGTAEEGWNQRRAEEELANVLADVRRGIWKPAPSEEASDEAREPTFHEFAPNGWHPAAMSSPPAPLRTTNWR